MPALDKTMNNEEMYTEDKRGLLMFFVGVAIGGLYGAGGFVLLILEKDSGRAIITPTSLYLFLGIMILGVMYLVCFPVFGSVCNNLREDVETYRNFWRDNRDKVKEAEEKLKWELSRKARLGKTKVVTKQVVQYRYSVPMPALVTVEQVAKLSGVTPAQWAERERQIERAKAEHEAQEQVRIAHEERERERLEEAERERLEREWLAGERRHLSAMLYRVILKSELGEDLLIKLDGVSKIDLVRIWQHIKEDAVSFSRSRICEVVTQTTYYNIKHFLDNLGGITKGERRATILTDKGREILQTAYSEHHERNKRVDAYNARLKAL